MARSVDGDLPSQKGDLTLVQPKVACLPGAPHDAVVTTLMDLGDSSHPKRPVLRLTAWSVGIDITSRESDSLLLALYNPETKWDDLLALLYDSAKDKA